MRSDRDERLEIWARWIYEERPYDRERALAMLAADPVLLSDEPVLACAMGDVAAVDAALARDPDFANRPGGPKAMPPLVAVTHSPLIRYGYEQALLDSARLLLRHGADPNGTWTDPRFPDSPLSALYGAAGRNHDAAMTALLLEAGADPNDGESLYHAVESPDLACARLLLDAGARVAGTNAVARALDFDNLPALRLLLAGRPDLSVFPVLHHAVLRGRSHAHVEALLEAGANPRAVDGQGVSFRRWAAVNGRDDLDGLLRKAGIAPDAETTEEAFVAACARADAPAARAIFDREPDIVSRLPEADLEALPRSAAQGRAEAVSVMLSLGWPREVTTGWGATALNHAVIRGDAAMTRLLLREGADWTTRHGYGDTVIGTLSFASQAEAMDVGGPGDYRECAAALIEGGVPLSAFRGYGYSPEIARDLEERGDAGA